jgi:hypothetical protein
MTNYLKLSSGLEGAHRIETRPLWTLDMGNKTALRSHNGTCLFQVGAFAHSARAASAAGLELLFRHGTPSKYGYFLF